MYSCSIFNSSSLPFVSSRNSLVEQNYSTSENVPPLGNSDNIDFLQSLKGFRFGHLNIASLVKHIGELKIYLEKEPLDINKQK